MCLLKRAPMRDVGRALQELRDDLARTQREITVLEQIGRELGKLVDGFGAEADSLIRRQLDEIARRTAAALAKQASIARMLEECARERRSSSAARPLTARRFARPKQSLLRPIAGRAETP